MKRLIIMEVAQMIAIFKANSRWLSIVLAIIILCSLKSKAAENAEKVTYLNILDMQVQMCDIWQIEDITYRSNRLVAILEEQKEDTFEQVFISTKDFVIINNLEEIVAPNWKIGDFYVYQKIFDGNGELYDIQGATKINTSYDSIIDNLSAYLQTEPIAIEPLEDISDIGSTSTEIASEIEPFNEHSTPLVDESDLESDETEESIPVEQSVEELDQSDVVQDPVEVSAEEQKETNSQEAPEVQIEEESVSVEVSAEDPVQDQKNYSYIAPSQVKSTTSTRQNNVVSDEQSTASVTTQSDEEQSLATESGNAENASTARTAIDGEQIVDDVTLHNDNVALQIGLWAVGGIAAAMMIVRLML